MKSLRARIVKGLSYVLLALFVLQWLLVTFAIRQVTENYAAARLIHEIESLVAAVQFDSPGRPRLESSGINEFYQRPFSGHYFRITSDDGTLVSRSLWDWTLDSPAVQPGEQQRWHTEGPQSQPLLALTQGFRKQGSAFNITVAEDMSLVNADIRRYQLGYAVLSAVFLLIIGGVTAWTTTRGLQPLQRAREELAALQHGHIRALDEAVPVEIEPLVRELNRVLALTNQRLERSRKAAGNLAHGLKTPLTVLSRLSAAPALRADAASREALETQVSRMRQLIDRELKRARLAGGGPSTAPFVAADDLPALARTLERIYDRRGIQVAVQVAAGHRFPSDREDMLELFGTLLDNACKWAQRSVSVQVTDQAGLVATIADDGPGIEEGRSNELLARGARLDQADTGHGLGLAIANDIVQQYGGTLALSRSDTLGGLEVQLMLPPPESTAATAARNVG